MYTPCDSPYLFLLVVFTVFTWNVRNEFSDVWFRNVCGTLEACLLGNLYIQSHVLQQNLHNVFVYCLLVGMLHSTCMTSYVLSTAIASVMLVTRLYFGRCIVLWWNEERNTDVDLLVLSMLVAGIFIKQRPFLPHALCIAAAVLSHWVYDCDAERVVT